MNLGEKFLHRLMDRAENAWARTDVPLATILFSEVGNSEYFSIKKATDKQDYHGVLLHAQSFGAVSIEWDITAGHQNQVKRVSLVDAAKLSFLLNITPRWESVLEASRLFSAHASEFPILETMIATWKSGQKIRNLGISDKNKILDAIKTISYCQQMGHQDVPIRRMSARLGFDTKRLEAIIPALDILTGLDINALPREKEEVLSCLGLVKHPSTIMISGCLSVQFKNNDEIAIPTPYLGLPPTSISRIDIKHTCKVILSIENLTTFHELAALNHPNTILIYSNGMPSPSWRRFYTMMIQNAPSLCELYHYGDVDAGGYRIAKNIFETAKLNGQNLKLYQMNPSELPSHYSWRKLENREVIEMRTNAKQCGWDKEYLGIEASCCAFEQEVLDLSFPDM